MEIHRMCEKHVACETELGLGTTHTWRLEGGVPHTRHSTRKPSQTWCYRGRRQGEGGRGDDMEGISHAKGCSKTGIKNKGQTVVPSAQIGG